MVKLPVSFWVVSLAMFFNLGDIVAQIARAVTGRIANGRGVRAPAAGLPPPRIGLRSLNLYRWRVAGLLAVGAAAFGADIRMRRPGAPGWLGAAVSVAASLAAAGLWLSWRAYARSQAGDLAEYAGLPRHIALARTWGEAVETYRRETAARYGEDAGAYGVKFVRLRYLGRLSVMVFYVGTFLYFSLLWRIRGPSWVPLSYVIFFSIMVGGGCVVAWQGLGAWERLRTAVAGVARVGVRALGPLPERPGEYRAWCMARNVDCYPFGKPDERGH